MSTPLAANPVDAAALADELLRFRLVDSCLLADLLAEFPGHGPEALAEQLIARGALNAFQSRRALAGGARWLTLGAYRLIGESNPGTFGPVYSAVHRDRPGEFRLQMFPLRSLWRARQAKQIARTLSSAPHPSIVPLADADSANGLHFLVWPLAEGTPLGDRVSAAGPLPVAEVLDLLVHLANALHACHLLGVAHGTITPKSILIGGELPRLLEQGAGAILSENLAADESLLDTFSATIATANVLAYAAPEFVTSPGVPTPAADQYALGAVGYFALTGRLPFPNGSQSEQLAAKLAGPPSPLNSVNPSLPPALGAVIDRMLRPEPGDRFANMSEVRNWLSADSVEFQHLPAPQTLLDFPGMSRRRASRTETSEPQTPRPQGELSLDQGLSRPARPNAIDTPGQIVIASQSVHSSPALPASPTSPQATPSPATEVQAMAKLALKPKLSDPRSTVGAPIHYHTEAPADPSSGPRPGLPPALPELGEPPVTDTHFWKRFKQNVMFWKPPTDVVQVSVFGPPSMTPGQSGIVSVYLHTPNAANSVNTLCRAFHHDAVLIGTGYVSREIARDDNVNVHLSVANAGVTKSMLTLVWRGQPHRLVFDLHVPWESPGGPAPGVVSIGLDNIRVGKVEFWLQLLPRKS